MSMQGAPQKNVVAPSWTWGSSKTIRVDNAVAPGPPPQSARVVTAQLAQVSLPEPAVCSLFFQATVTSVFLTDTVTALTLNLNEGVGRTTVPRQVVYASQPAPGAPLEVTIPFLPLHALNVDIALNVQLLNAVGSLIVLETYLVLSPLTRIPQKEQELAFGMALPGEADSLDDELREELDAEGPTVQQTILAEYDGRVEGDDQQEAYDDEGELDDDDQVERVPAWLLDLISRLELRLGRRPSKLELASAVRRLRQRAQRRQERSR